MRFDNKVEKLYQKVRSYIDVLSLDVWNINSQLVLNTQEAILALEEALKQDQRNVDDKVFYNFLKSAKEEIDSLKHEFYPFNELNSLFEKATQGKFSAAASEKKDALLPHTIKYSQELRDTFESIKKKRASALQQIGRQKMGSHYGLHSQTDEAIKTYAEELTQAQKKGVFDVKKLTDFIKLIENEYKDTHLKEHLLYNPISELRKIEDLTLPEQKEKSKKSQAPEDLRQLASSLSLDALQSIEEEEEPSLDSDSESESVSESDEEIEVKELPEDQNNFIELLKNTLTIKDDHIDVETDYIQVDMSTKDATRELKTQALVDVLIKLGFDCSASRNPDGSLDELVQIKLPLPDTLNPINGPDGENITLSLQGNQENTLKIFRRYFQDHYMSVVNDNPSKKPAAPAHPIYSQQPTPVEIKFLISMRKLETLLVNLLDTSSVEYKWVKNSQYLPEIEALTQEMLSALKPFKPHTAHHDYNPTAETSYVMALRNLKDNSNLMLNFIRVNPKVLEILNKSMELLQTIKRDFDSQPKEHLPAAEEQRPRTIKFTSVKYSKDKPEPKITEVEIQEPPKPRSPGRPE